MSLTMADVSNLKSSNVLNNYKAKQNKEYNGRIVAEIDKNRKKLKENKHQKVEEMKESKERERERETRCSQNLMHSKWMV